VFDRHESQDHVVYDDRADVVAHQRMFKILAHPQQDLAFFSTASPSLRGTRRMSVDLQTKAVATVVDRRDTSSKPRFVTSEFEYPTSVPAIGVMKGIHTYMIAPAASGK